MILDTTICKNCGQEFGEHTYVPDSIDQYRCTRPRQETGYGAFHGGDPRLFHPDGECSTPTELEDHRKACEAWDEAEAEGKSPPTFGDESGWFTIDGSVVHVLKSVFGIGIYTMEFEQFFEELERDEQEEETCEECGGTGSVDVSAEYEFPGGVTAACPRCRSSESAWQGEAF